MQVTTMANILKDAKIVKKNSNEAKAIEEEKTIIINNYSTIIYNGSKHHQTFI